MNRFINAVKAKMSQLFGNITDAEMQRLENIAKCGDQSKIRTKRAQLSRCAKNCKSICTVILAGFGVNCVKGVIEIFSDTMAAHALVKESVIVMTVATTVAILVYVIVSAIGNKAETLLEEFDKLESRFNKERTN